MKQQDLWRLDFPCELYKLFGLHQVWHPGISGIRCQPILQVRDSAGTRDADVWVQRLKQSLTLPNGGPSYIRPADSADLSVARQPYQFARAPAGA